MACDFTFAVILEEVYAKRYLEFRNEDIDWICRKCHEAYNKFSKKDRNSVISWADWAKVHVKNGYRVELENRRIEMLELYLRWKKKRTKYFDSRRKK
jgi:hypothetical protein